jgi:hypothetical protein
MTAALVAVFEYQEITYQTQEFQDAGRAQASRHVRGTRARGSGSPGRFAIEAVYDAREHLFASYASPRTATERTPVRAMGPTGEGLGRAKLIDDRLQVRLQRPVTATAPGRAEGC